MSGVAILVGAAVVQADAVATNGGATGVGATTATLHGTVDPSNADSIWYFQYGTSTSYGRTTTATPIGSGSAPVSTSIAGLTAGTRYHFQLVVEQDVSDSDNPPTTNYSDDLLFTTLTGSSQHPKPGGSGQKYGKASLKSRKLKVSAGEVSIVFSCAGASSAVCKGKVTVAARGRLHGKRTTVGCGAGSWSSSGGHTQTVRGRLSSGCKSLLKAAKKHTLGAKLKATYATNQSSLKTPVTLVG